MRRALRAFSSILIIAGTLLIVDAGLTLAWQEPVSAVYARITQNRLAGQLETIELKNLNEPQRDALARLRTERRRIAFLARVTARKTREGKALGRIKIPKIGANFVVVQGVEPGTLRKGPGHYPDTAMPGLRTTSSIAGHRTTYLAPFRKVDKLRRGDTIELEMPYAKFTYRVQRTQIVDPSAVWVNRRVGYERLVLTACHPLYSAAQRIVVFARVAKVEPRGAARSATAAN